jgi:methylenetetrahydrofolate/methylenetetrahydromethanopterin dehydrogenase (NADP+)
MQNILIQLDTDPLPSTFDRVVAVDAGVDELFAYGGVTPENVESLVHGAMFTRGPQDLRHTAIWIGGSDVAAGEALLEAVQSIFFGPLRVSVMMDSNGSNTTAAAAVLAAGKHLDLAGAKCLVLGGTGPVGLRAAELLAREGANVRLASRSMDRARTACERIAERVESGSLSPCESHDAAAPAGVALIVAAGAAGVTFLDETAWQRFDGLKVAIDLNAVPPLGLAGIDVTDKAVERHGVVCYGAIGVGGSKMKLHRAAVASLFESNDRLLDTESIYALGGTL